MKGHNINHEYKTIFVHVPKNGGVSIKDSLQTTWEGGEHHRDIRQIREICIESYGSESGNELFSTYFKFGFVRNPWDRVVSLYFRNEGIHMKHSMTFEQFVDWIEYSTDTCKFPTRKRNQLDWFLGEDGKVLVDFIGRFENFQEDFAYICNRILFPCPHLRHSNKGDHRPYWEYYTDETKEIIGKKFKTDIEYFGYEFGKKD